MVRSQVSNLNIHRTRKTLKPGAAKLLTSVAFVKIKNWLSKYHREAGECLTCVCYSCPIEIVSRTAVNVGNCPTFVNGFVNKEDVYQPKRLGSLLKLLR